MSYDCFFLISARNFNSKQKIFDIYFSLVIYFVYRRVNILRAALSACGGELTIHTSIDIRLTTATVTVPI